MLHPDEGTIHAWLDGQLPRDEAAALEAHVAECRSCADAVAEARGLIAASSRILMALDGVPRDVAPKQPAPVDAVILSEAKDPRVILSEAKDPAVPPPNAIIDLPSRAATIAARKRPLRRWLSGPSLAAAAAVIVAVGSFAVLENRDDSLKIAAEAPSDVSGPSASATPSVAPAPPPTRADEPNAAAAVGSAKAANEARRQLADAVTPTGQRAERAPQAPGDAALSASVSAEKAGRDEAKEADLLRAKKSSNVDSAPARQAFAQARPAETEQLKKADTSTVLILRGAAAQRGAPAPGAPAVVAQPPQAPPPTTPGSVATRDARADAAAPNASSGSIVGRVVDGNGTGIPEAQVVVVGTSTGSLTNAQGEFRLGGVSPGQVQLMTRRIGYEPHQQTVTVVAGQSATVNAIIKPTALSLSEVVVTGTGVQQNRREAGNALAAVTASESAAVGCYELGITTTDTRVRAPLRQIPRRIALDGEIVPSNADGIWYRARDLTRTGVVADGQWRPVGTDGVEIEWTYGTKVARIRLTGPPRAMMRGTVEEMDRSADTLESGTVVSSRRNCQ